MAKKNKMKLKHFADILSLPLPAIVEVNVSKVSYLCLQMNSPLAKLLLGN